VGGDDEVRLGVLVDEAGGGLQVLEAQVLALQAVRDHSACSSLQHCNTEILTSKAVLESVLRIRIRIHRIHMFLSLDTSD
jgi:hypothetical protein